MLLVSSCQRAKASVLSDRTRVCVTIVTVPFAVEPRRRPRDPSRSWLSGELAEDAIRCERQMREAHTGRVRERIGDGGRDRIDRALALRLRAERAMVS